MSCTFALLEIPTYERRQSPVAAVPSMPNSNDMQARLLLQLCAQSFVNGRRKGRKDYDYILVARSSNTRTPAFGLPIAQETTSPGADEAYAWRAAPTRVSRYVLYLGFVKKYKKNLSSVKKKTEKL